MKFYLYGEHSLNEVGYCDGETIEQLQEHAEHCAVGFLRLGSDIVVVNRDRVEVARRRWVESDGSDDGIGHYEPWSYGPGAEFFSIK